MELGYCRKECGFARGPGDGEEKEYAGVAVDGLGAQGGRRLPLADRSGAEAGRQIKCSKRG